jgi:hypothetical protein
MTRPKEAPPEEADLLASDAPPALAESRWPVYDVAPERAERIRQAAHVLLRKNRQVDRQPAGSAWSRSYHRFVEPAVLIGLGLWQLAWTVQDTVALFR